ncbi:universal stress protein [Rathayibacter sp. VKM Ac-2856]|uniref:universal stress protein n=1 Tax=unclassified Rathayibacter TaxID=2609250 RepID=UPI00156364BB|nr:MULTISPECIES: universal stress protein [unclassified Rathayibacter]NQX05416.1 universal stress protein [Rathayibacter sp. VKM Ac-2858]NQX20709.1 universal stress protein [Rathayibacter sp. VKM Ac-2856]
MTESTPSGPVLVGVVDGQRPEVVRTAAGLAAGLGAPLLLLTVVGDPYLVGEYVDPMTGGIPVGLVPRSGGGDDGPTEPPGLRAEIESALSGTAVDWTLRTVQGEPALVLTDVAEEVDARMIVVGTREAGMLAGIAEFLSGSVAVHLAHRQHRPVLVVPRADGGTRRRVPWATGE